MVRTDENVWQLSLRLPPDNGAAEGDLLLGGVSSGDGNGGRRGAAAAGPRFSYFVIDKGWMTGSAELGNTYLVPGARASVMRPAASN
jgi:hypothetical protein